METLKVKLTFIEECLGTMPGDQKVFQSYIASKAPDAKTLDEEIAAVGQGAVEQKQKTFFPKEKGNPFVYDYQIKGFFKAACQACKNMPKSASSGVKAFKKLIDQLIFIKERKIFLRLPKGKKIGECQRPLRASGPQGERIALANSETVPIGTSMVFTIIDLSEKSEKLIREWLDYGQYNGLLQWRNSGKGRFEWSEE